jgi:arsenic resistance protein ArsH
MNEFLSVADLPNIDPELLEPIDVDGLVGPGGELHPPRILILYGSLRTRSYSRFLAVATI